MTRICFAFTVIVDVLKSKKATLTQVSTNQQLIKRSGERALNAGMYRSLL